MKLRRKDFPHGFLFGAATAAYQIEGHSFGGAGKTHWDTFAQTPGNVAHGHDGAIACDHFHHYEQDLDLLENGGFDAYRFSTSWARVLPEGRGQVNQTGLDYYDRLVDAMLIRGLKPFQTLYHWEMPSALADLGGWANRDVAGWFGDYTEIITACIGDRIHSVATINEPWCVAYLSHFLGAHAPGLRDIRATARAMHHVGLAHGEAMLRLRAAGQKNCGIVLNFEYSQPGSDDPLDVSATRTHDAIFNRWFIQSIMNGSYPKKALHGLAPHMPGGWQDDMKQINQPIDWLGVNYYSRSIIGDDKKALWPSYKKLSGERKTTQMGWEVYPEGLEYFLTWLGPEYTGDIPIYVTENGMAWDDHVTYEGVQDPERTDFVDKHLQSVYRAIKRGANIQGYFYWSLLDNFEWAEGYDKRFGIVHVDFETQKRIPKATYHKLKSAISRD